jgi:predicted aminopeptidase
MVVRTGVVAGVEPGTTGTGGRVRSRALRRAVLALSLIVLTVGCSIDKYYVQSISGQFDLLRKSRSIAAVLSDEAVPPQVRERLALVREVRQFAVRELGLPDSQSYSRFADVGRDFVVWNVFAAPALSVDPTLWCFPVAGCVAYRGYFQRERAMEFAEARRAEGYDVYVGGVRAYSTLGWFNDPVLNTYLHYADVDLAALIFHELAHEHYYLSGDTVFNESFATVVEREGIRRWLAARGESDLYQRHVQMRARDAEVVEVILGYRNRLRMLYASELDTEAKLQRKEELVMQLRQEYDELRSRLSDEPDGLRMLPRELNNAYLAVVGSYNGMVPAFDTLLRRHDGDLTAFYDSVKALGQLPRDQRNTRLAELSNPIEGVVAGLPDTPASVQSEAGDG